MNRPIAILVEGQTEEAFVNQILQPHLGDSAWLTPIVVHTSRAADGTARRGGGSWNHYDRMLRPLIAQPHWSLVTTLLDFYGYPSDAPQCSCVSHHAQPACIESREQAIADSLPYSATFRPYVALHEFETVVIAAGAASPNVLGSSSAAKSFREMIAAHNGDAEQINNGPETAPSKRVAGVLDSYSKVRDGIAILENNFDAALCVTPRLRDWVERLRDLS
ncbi:DUF4276 family protein [Agromyces sp. NPDC055520]